MSVPRLGDPGASPRFHKGGESRRARATFAAEAIGPWHGEVAVTPIERPGRRAFFELTAEWGPGPADEDVPGLTGIPSRHALDSAAFETAEAAERVARAAVDALRSPPAGRLPPLNLMALAKQLGVPLLRQG